MTGEHSEHGETLHPAGEDFVAEVSDLDPAPFTGDVPAETDSASAGPAGATARRAPLGLRLSRRQRLVRQLTTAGVVALALALVLGSVPGVRDQAARAFRGPPPAPTAGLGAGVGYWYIARGVPWATVTVDGQALAHPPVIGLDLPLWLPRGRHTIIWRADPFAPVTCAISTPIAQADSCPYDRVYLYQPEAKPSDWVLTLFPTLTMLSAGQRVALLQAARTALATLDSSTTIRPGERYATSYVPTIATQPLRATLAYQLVTDTTQMNSSCANVDGQLGCNILGQDCAQVCTVPETGPSDYWSVYVVGRLQWTFTTLGGQALVAPQDDVIYATGTLIPLRIRWVGAQWQVQALTTAPTTPYVSYLNPPNGLVDNDPACRGFQEDINLEQALPAPTDPLYNVLAWQYLPATQHADGCVAAATISAYTVSSPPSVPPPTPLLLRRFGVVLAANAVAHRLWPSLPVADAYEKNMAAQIVALSGGTAAGGDGSSR